jgi:hypothetical protein
MPADAFESGRQLRLSSEELALEQCLRAANRLLANNANALASLRRGVGVLSEHHEGIVRGLAVRFEQGVAGVVEMLIGELSSQVREKEERDEERHLALVAEISMLRRLLAMEGDNE